MAAVAPEILLSNLLNGGFAALKADYDLVSDVFSTLSSGERAELREFFSKEIITVRIGKPPRGPDYRVPLVVIEAISDEEVAEQDLLGDQLYDFEDSMEYGAAEGVRLRSTYNLVMVGKDNRQARILYRTTVALLILYRYDLENAGFQNRRMSGNRDVVVDLGADPLEGKVMSITGEHWFSVRRSERLSPLVINVAITSEVPDIGGVSSDVNPTV
jgi:hypothetical protein